jgi:hypothetical protein
LNETALLAAAFCLAAVPVCWCAQDDVLSGRELLRAMREGDGRNDRRAPGDKATKRTAKTSRRKGDGNRPSAMELLDKYAATQAELQSFTIKSWSLHDFHATTSGGRTRKKTLTVNELRFDGERIFRRYGYYYNDEIKIGRTGTPRPKTKLPGKIMIRVYDGKCFIVFKRGDKFLRIQRENAREHASDILDGHFGSREIMGYFAKDSWHEGNRIDGVLRKANSMSARERMERIGASECYVIDAESPRGRYTVWIDPQHGYNIAKAEVFRGARQCKTTGGRSNNCKSFFASVSNVRFRKIEDVWVPMEADVEIRYEANQDGTGQMKTHHKRTEVILNPDHEALRSFYPEDIPNEWPVGPRAFVRGTDIEGGPDVQEEPWAFRWEPKARFLVNDSCRVVRNDPDDHVLPIVKVLPVLSDSMGYFQFNPVPSGVRRKHIVLCFWDINQQQSRKLLMSLRDMQKDLTKNGVAIIAAETSGAQTDKVHSWAKQNKLTFPVGAFYGEYERSLSRMIRNMEEDGEKVDMDDRKKKKLLAKYVTALRKIWAIEKLPWLILTNRDRVVIAEGLDLEELNDILTDQVLFEAPTSKPPSLSEPNKGATTPLKLLPDGLQEDLILYYSFDEDEGGRVTDLSGNGNHGRVHGAKHAQERGGAMNFYGLDNYISVEDIELKEYSFSAWVRTSRSAADNRLIFVSEDWVHRHALQDNSFDSLSIVADSGEINERDRPFATNVWAHVILTHSKSSFNLYKNGKLIKEGYLESSPVTDTLYLGGKEKAPKRSWPGMIDEVAVFNRALTEQEVKLLYKNTIQNK